MSIVTKFKGKQGEIDLNDSILMPVYMMSILVVFGVGSVSLQGYSLADTAFSAGSENITYAFILSMITMGIALGTNRPDLHGFADEEKVAVGATLILVLGIEFIPLVQSLMDIHWAIPLISSFVAGVGYLVLSWF